MILLQPKGATGGVPGGGEIPMEQVRNLPLMNFPISALPTAPGVSRTNKVCKRFPEQKEHLTVT